MYLDRPKGYKILKEELKKEKVQSAAFALSGDEFWNYEIFYEDGKRKNQKDFKCYHCSYWATPVVVFTYADGKEKRVPCYFDEEDNAARAKKLESNANRKKEGLRRKLKKSLKSLKK